MIFAGLYFRFLRRVHKPQKEKLMKRKKRSSNEKGQKKEIKLTGLSSHHLPTGAFSTKNFNFHIINRRALRSRSVFNQNHKYLSNNKPQHRMEAVTVSMRISIFSGLSASENYRNYRRKKTPTTSTNPWKLSNTKNRNRSTTANRFTNLCV